MKTILISLFISFCSISYGQQLGCEKVKDGKFEINDPRVGKSTIERKGTKQIEYGELSNLKLEFTVNWLNSCTYTLVLKEIIENPQNLKWPEEMVLTVEILEVKEKSYIQKTKSNLSDLVLEAEVFFVD